MTVVPRLIYEQHCFHLAVHYIIFFVLFVCEMKNSSWHFKYQILNEEWIANSIAYFSY